MNLRRIINIVLSFAVMTYVSYDVITGHKVDILQVWLIFMLGFILGRSLYQPTVCELPETNE